MMMMVMNLVSERSASAGERISRSRTTFSSTTNLATSAIARLTIKQPDAVHQVVDADLAAERAAQQLPAARDHQADGQREQRERYRHEQQAREPLEAALDHRQRFPQETHAPAEAAPNRSSRLRRARRRVMMRRPPDVAPAAPPAPRIPAGPVEGGVRIGASALRSSWVRPSQAPPGELPQRRDAVPVPLQTTSIRRHRPVHLATKLLDRQLRLASHKALIARSGADRMKAHHRAGQHASASFRTSSAHDQGADGSRGDRDRHAVSPGVRVRDGEPVVGSPTLRSLTRWLKMIRSRR